MPSWSTSEAPPEPEGTSPDRAAAERLAAARKLLEELFAEPAADDESPQTGR